MPHNKVKKVILLACYIFLLLFYSLLFCASARAQDSSQPALSFTPNVNIGPGFQQGVAQPVNESTLGNYIATWYGFVIGTIGILAAIMIMYGGVKWLTSRGGQAVSDAKDIIFSALIGLTLAFLSYTILNLVNPNLLKIGLPKMGAITYTDNFALAVVNPSMEGGTGGGAGGGSAPADLSTLQQNMKTTDQNIVNDAEGKGVNVPDPTSTARPGGQDMHELNRAVDYPKNDPAFNKYMNDLIHDPTKSTPTGYGWNGPFYYVTFPDGTKGRVGDEANCWHIDNGQQGEVIFGTTI